MRTLRDRPSKNLQTACKPPAGRCRASSPFETGLGHPSDEQPLQRHEDDDQRHDRDGRGEEKLHHVDNKIAPFFTEGTPLNGSLDD
jgi:hypothetical protein